LGDIDPIPGARRFQSGFDYTNSFKPVYSVNQRLASLFNRI
jgi:hypothetical protein